MKKLLVMLCLPAVLGVSLFAQEKADIVIEMDGSATAGPSVSVGQYSARELAKKFKDKTLSAVLSAATTVPTRRENFTGKHRQTFTVLRYGDETDFRQLLFYAQEPQTFVAAADSVSGILRWRDTYGVEIAVSRRAFEKAFPQAARSALQNLKTGQTLDVFLLKNAPAEKPFSHYYIFEQERLKQVLKDQAAYDSFAAQIAADNKAFNELQRQKKEQAQKPRPTVPERPKALSYGGTQDQYLYGPRLVKGKRPMEKANFRKKSGQNSAVQEGK